MASITIDPGTGVFKADEAYSLGEAQRRLGFGIHAMRSARRAGLQTRKVGRRKYLLGADILAYLASRPVAK